MSATRESRAPKIRLRTPGSVAEALRAHLTRHNRQVIGLAIGTFLAAIGAWLLLYFICTWILVFNVALFDLPFTRIPRGFTIVFIVAAVCALVYTWIDNRLTPNDRPSDKKRPLEIAADFALAIPRMTLSVGSTLSARQNWEDEDYQQAATLLQRLAEKRRVPMASVRLDIPDSETAMRVLFGLQITQVVEVLREENEFWLKLSALRPDSLKLTRETYADA